MNEINFGTTNDDTLKKVFELLSDTKASGTVQGENYKLTFDDVKELHKVYCALETEIKGTEKKTGAAYLKEIETYLISALKYEARNISKKREVEFAKFEKEIDAKKEAETPETWRNWWWLFKLHRNRAQELVDEEAEINADYLHNVKEADLNRLEKELEQIEVGTTADESLSLRKRIKLRRKITKHKRALRRLEKKWRTAEPKQGESVDIPKAAPATASAPMREQEHKKKPKTRTKNPVVVIEQLPGQIDIETAQQQ